MTSILIKIIPLDLASTLSPGILALAIILLGSKNYPKARTLAMLCGTLLVAVILAILGFVIGNNVTPGTDPTVRSAIIDMVFGLVFVYYGIKIILSKERKIEPKEGSGAQFFKWFAIGFIISATNFDAVLLNFAAAKEVGDAAINYFDKIILLIINSLFFALPIILPLVAYLIFPKFAGAMLEKLNRVVLKYSRYILFAMFFLFGLYFLIKGIGFFF